ncbi:MAG: thiol peroxidase [Bacteroides sp.]
MGHKVQFAGSDIELLGDEIMTGLQAPEFTGVGMDLKPVEFKGGDGKFYILSVFPSIDTPVCSLQATRFNAEASHLDQRVNILAISCDLPFALSRYCGAHGIDRLTMVSDHRDLSFGKAYGFILDGLRLLARGVVVIDDKGIVRYVEYVPEVTHEPNYGAALAAVKSLLK